MDYMCNSNGAGGRAEDGLRGRWEYREEVEENVALFVPDNI